MGDENDTLEVRRAAIMDQVRGAVTDSVDAAMERAFSPTGTAAQTAVIDRPQEVAPQPWIVQMAQSLPEDRVPQAGDVITRTQEGTWLVLPESEVAARVHYATQRQGIMGSIESLDGIGGFDIPWGSILVGAVPGAIVGELVDGFITPKQPDGSVDIANVLVKVGAGAAGVAVTRRFVGNRASTLFAGAIGLQLLSQVSPLNIWVQNLVQRIRGIGKTVTAPAPDQMQGQVEQRQLPVTTPSFSGNPIVNMLEAVPNF